MSFRNTLARELTVSGTALHAGTLVTMTLKPGTPGDGVIFRRRDKADAEIPALYDRVGETRLGTVIAQDGISVGVIEHLMAAVAGAGIDDLLVILDGPEPPILDGDALSYLVLIERAGVTATKEPRRAIRVLREVTVSEKNASATLHPANETAYDFLLEYDTPAIGRQDFRFVFSPGNFRELIAPARTFGFAKDLEALNAMSLAKGASLENTLALDEAGVINKDRQRFADEFVRHKILDAIGDMALAGAPLIARFEGIRSGHGLNNRLLRALFADPANYEMVMLP
ncbi:MAG: UDP-3-O-[3-hydroxymyristoyl] N-acetylglucosamine deacetylase [Alphaproteobacteria bacterium]|nr:UDP-3-O-[3-hydroxymyristoyl] N-acetylglucosamine deacetylase [Alphaproteobacteria bacterium]